LQPQGLLNLKYHGHLKVLLSGAPRQELGKAPVSPLLQCPVWCSNGCSGELCRPQRRIVLCHVIAGCAL